MQIMIKGVMTDAKTIVLGEDGFVMLSPEHFVVVPETTEPAPPFPKPEHI